MPLIAAYHRPPDLQTALDLLARPGHVALAGGTVLNADREPSDLAAVDLRDLGLGSIEAAGGSLRLGATATLDEVSRHPGCPEWLVAACRAEMPSTLRTLATIGGTVAARGPDSVLLAVLLAADARVELARGGAPALDEILDTGVPDGDLVCAVTVDTDGEVATAATGRTPADVPIVAAVARTALGGPRLALTGVATRVVLVDPDDPTAGLDPPGDFRGSGPYRRHLAATLSRRVLEALR